MQKIALWTKSTTNHTKQLVHRARDSKTIIIIYMSPIQSTSHNYLPMNFQQTFLLPDGGHLQDVLVVMMKQYKNPPGLP